MRHTRKASLRRQIFRMNMILIAVTLGLTLAITLAVTLEQERQAMDDNLLNSARLIAQEPTVRVALEKGESSAQLCDFLDVATARISDIDVIVLADENSMQLYYPDRSYIGQPYAGKDQQKIFEGKPYYTSQDTGLSGAERCAYAEVRGEDGSLLGFVMIGIYMRNYSALVHSTVLRFVLIIAVAAVLGIFLAMKLSERIKRPLMGHEPEDFSNLFFQREDILDALEEGILAIDAKERVIYMNKAATRMINVDRGKALHLPLREVYPASHLPRVIRSGKPEYNLNLNTAMPGQILAYHIPMLEEGRAVGAVSILRSRTAVTQMAEDLTGVRHMVEAMRSYTHEFMNKLHVVLGLLQIGEHKKAEEYIMDVTRIQQKAVGLITDKIQNSSVAALLVGKTSKCAEMGIHLELDPKSELGQNMEVLPPDAYVTVLGNLIENAIDELNRIPRGEKLIAVSIRTRGTEQLISVEDTGPGIPPEILECIFERNFSTKGAGHGTGLTLVEETVKAFGGNIRVESELGVGTTFFVSFPRRGLEEGETEEMQDCIAR